MAPLSPASTFTKLIECGAGMARAEALAEEFDRELATAIVMQNQAGIDTARKALEIARAELAMYKENAIAIYGEASDYCEAILALENVRQAMEQLFRDGPPVPLMDDQRRWFADAVADFREGAKDIANKFKS